MSNKNIIITRLAYTPMSLEQGLTEEQTVCLVFVFRPEHFIFFYVRVSTYLSGFMCVFVSWATPAHKFY